MHCTQCGVELVPDAKFCSGCGFALGEPYPASPVVRTRDWDLHVSILGWLVIAHAAVTGFSSTPRGGISILTVLPGWR